MYQSKLKTSLFLILVACAMFLVSCDKFETFEEEDETENFFGSLFDGDNNDDGENDNDNDFDELCFEIVFPISVDFPDGEVTAFENEESLWVAVEEWYENIADRDTLNTQFVDPMFVFPIEVKYDGVVKTINNDEELCDLWHLCEDEWDDDEWEGDEEYHDKCEDYLDWISTDLADCYDIVYPISVMVDSVVYTINSAEEVDTVFAIIAIMLQNDEELDIELVYPITILDQSTNAEISISSEIQLIELAIACEIISACFSINYPINLINPDGSTQEITNDAELIAAYVAFEMTDSDDELVPQFPIDVTLDNGDVLTKTNLEDLEALYDNCD